MKHIIIFSILSVGCMKAPVSEECMQIERLTIEIAHTNGKKLHDFQLETLKVECEKMTYEQKKESVESMKQLLQLSRALKGG